MPQPYPRAAVSVAVCKGDEVLLVRRGKGAYEGLWSLPGGSIALGEGAVDAARRELREETGLLALELSLGDVAGAIVRDNAGEIVSHYVISVFAVDAWSGELAPGSDASDAKWCGPEARAALACTPGLEAAITRAKAALKLR
jgi:8-oxo-dGTP diphosphatase